MDYGHSVSLNWQNSLFSVWLFSWVVFLYSIFTLPVPVAFTVPVPVSGCSCQLRVAFAYATKHNSRLWGFFLSFPVFHASRLFYLKLLAKEAVLRRDPVSENVEGVVCISLEGSLLSNGLSSPFLRLYE